MLATFVFLTALASWCMLLTAFGLGLLRKLPFTRAGAFTFAPFMMLSTLGLAFLAVRELCSTMASSCTHDAATPSEWHSTIPAALFGALFLQALMHLYLHQGSPRTLLVAPCVTIHLCTCLYYVLGETLDAGCALSNRWGTETRPLHYALWLTSMSAQLLTLHGLERSLAPLSKENLSAMSGAQADWASRRCCFALVCVVGMLLLTLYVDVLNGPLWLHLGVFACFYITLVAGLAIPLFACSRHVLLTTTSRAVALKHNLRGRFRAIAFYLLFVWHIFPVVWAAGLLGWLSPHSMRVGYVICDVFAKFLPATLYLSVATGSL
jgi:bacteriorhodopsin